MIAKRTLFLDDYCTWNILVCGIYSTRLGNSCVANQKGRDEVLSAGVLRVGHLAGQQIVLFVLLGRSGVRVRPAQPDVGAPVLGARGWSELCRHVSRRLPPLDRRPRLRMPCDECALLESFSLN